jgi:hypothetical protein
MKNQCKHPEGKIDWSPFLQDKRFFIFKCTECHTVVGFALNPISVGHKKPEPEELLTKQQRNQAT